MRWYPLFPSHNTIIVNLSQHESPHQCIRLTCCESPFETISFEIIFPLSTYTLWYHFSNPPPSLLHTGRFERYALHMLDTWYSFLRQTQVHQLDSTLFIGYICLIHDTFFLRQTPVHPLDSSLFIGCGPAWGLVAWTRWSLPPKMLLTRWMSNTATAKMAAKLSSPLLPTTLSLSHSLSNGSTENRIGGKFWLPFVLNWFWFWFWSLGLNLVWILICVWFELGCLVSIGYGGWFPSIYSWGWRWLGLDNC